MNKYLVFNVKDGEVDKFFGTSDDPRLDNKEFTVEDSIINLPPQFMLGNTYPCLAFRNADGRVRVVWVPLGAQPLSL